MPVAFILNRLDAWLLNDRPHPALSGWRRFCLEFLAFGVKQARACLFAGAFFGAVFLVPRSGIGGLPRYDVLLAFALVLQAWMLWRKVETWDEAKTIAIFHLAGFALEAFKVSGGIRSWSYPDPAYTKLLGVPLFSGFMYAAVGSYVMQSWRIMKLRVVHHPPFWMTALLAAAMYANFFTHHALPDFRWYLTALGLGLYARCMVVFIPLDRERRMPLFLGFVLIGFFIWIAENMGTFFGIWRYPNQMGAWATVSMGKWHAWAMLALLSFTLVTNLKHVKARIHIAP